MKALWPRRPAPPAPAVRAATDDDLPDILRLLTISLVHSPRSALAVPDPHRPVTAWRDHLGHVATTALRTGTVTITTTRTAVAVWQPHHQPGGHPAVTTTSMAGQHRLAAFHALLHAGHPHSGHHDLVHLAVHPDWHGHGLATALLHHHHGLLDALGISAVAHVDTEASRRLLYRHGYTTVPPESSPPGLPLMTLTRTPRTRP